MPAKRTTKKAPAKAGADDAPRATDGLSAFFRRLANTPHKELKAKLANEESQLTAPRATDGLMTHNSAAERVFKRDAARQKGTRAPRQPELQGWIADQVARGTGETAAELWGRAPDWITDVIGFDRFRKRMTAAKKAMKAAASK